MKKYTQLALIVICIISVLALLVCERRYANMKVILEVMDVFETKDSAVKCERQMEAFRRSHLGSLSGAAPAVLPVWREVLGGAFSVYSAFWDCESEQNASRVIVTFEKSLPPDLRCFVWFDNSHHVEADKLGIQVLDVQGTSSAAVLECVVRNVSLEPLGVSFSSGNEPSVVSQIISLQPTDGIATSNFSVCGPPLASSVTPLTLAEFTIYHRHIGVEDFVFYDGDALPNAKRLLAAVPATTYATLTILPWNVPTKFLKVSESARVADCLLRTKRRSRGTLFLDTNQFVSLYRAKDLNELSRGLGALVDANAADQVTLFHTHYFCDEFSDDVVASSLDIKFVTQRKVRYHRISEKHSVFLVRPGFSRAMVAALRNPNHPVEGNVLVPERSAVVNVYRQCRSLFPFFMFLVFGRSHPSSMELNRIVFVGFLLALAENILVAGRWYVYNYEIAAEASAVGSTDDTGDMKLGCRVKRCVFSSGGGPPQEKGFWIQDQDLLELSRCPVIVSLSDGAVSGLEVPSAEPEHVLNIKRALVSAFVLKRSHLLRGADTQARMHALIGRTDVHGTCPWRMVPGSEPGTAHSSKDMRHCSYPQRADWHLSPWAVVWNLHFIQYLINSTVDCAYAASNDASHLKSLHCHERHAIKLESTHDTTTAVQTNIL
ncbi:unnamed protein product [Ixodes hexagonus]